MDCGGTGVWAWPWCGRGLQPGAWPKEGALTDWRGRGFTGRGFARGVCPKGGVAFKVGAWSLGWQEWSCCGRGLTRGRGHMGALRRGAAILCWGVAMLWAWPNKGRGQNVGVAFKAVAMWPFEWEGRGCMGVAKGGGVVEGRGLNAGGVAIVWCGGVSKGGAWPLVGKHVAMFGGVAIGVGEWLRVGAWPDGLGAWLMERMGAWPHQLTPPSSVLLAPPPDRYIIVGARRDSLGPGAAASGVGTALLLELARVLGAMARAGELPHMAP